MQGLKADDPLVVGGIKIYATLGEGGFGRVLLGRSRLQDWVAVKVLKEDFTDGEWLKRFQREARLGLRIDSPYFASVKEVSVSSSPPYIVSQFVPGPTLFDATQRRDLRSPDEVLAIAAGLAAALDDLDSAGVIHRDIKPSNVILSEAGPVLIDLGIAKAPGDPTITRTGLLAGTPRWMSPEQERGEVLTPASDVWAWGALIESLVADGRSVHAGLEDLHRLARRAQSRDPSHRPTAQELVLEICKDLQVDEFVKSRWRRIRGIVQAQESVLVRLLADGPLTGSHDPLSTVVQPPQPDTPVPVPVKRSTGLWAGAVLVLAVSLVLLTLGAVIYLDQQRRVTSSAPVPVPVVVSPVPAPSADMTVTATATATTTATATATTTAEAIVPSPSPLVTTQTSTGSVTDAEAEQRLFDLRRVDLPNVAQGAWYASLSTKCAPMTAVDIYGPRGFGFPDGLSESYPGGIGNSTILALAYQYKQTYGDDVRTVIVDDVRPDADEYAQLCGGDFNLPMWVTLHTGVSASNPDVVLEWCRSQGIVSGECGAYPVGLPGEKPRWTT